MFVIPIIGIGAAAAGSCYYYFKSPEIKKIDNSLKNSITEFSRTLLNKTETIVKEGYRYDYFRDKLISSINNKIKLNPIKISHSLKYNIESFDKGKLNSVNTKIKYGYLEDYYREKILELVFLFPYGILKFNCISRKNKEYLKLNYMREKILIQIERKEYKLKKYSSDIFPFLNIIREKRTKNEYIKTYSYRTRLPRSYLNTFR